MNLGKKINTFQSDATPFLAADGKTLYFASCGHLGYGGYDVFMSKRLDDTWKNWSKPINLGPNVNSSAGELGFSVPASGDVAYTYSWRNDYYHSDIFSIALSPLVKPDPVTIVYGQVLDAKTRKPLGAKIEYELLPSGTNAGYANSNPTDGNYKIVLNNGNTYGYSAEVPGYFSVHENITIDSKALYTEIHVDLLMVPIEKGQKMTLQNVFFHQSTPDLIESSYPELDRLIEVLKSNPAVRIELDGHTDNQGDASLNFALSEKRVVTVKNYLVGKGIKESQKTKKEFKEKKPVAPNNT
jgi:OOP family OmpA-OmpF porin